MDMGGARVSFRGARNTPRKRARYCDDNRVARPIVCDVMRARDRRIANVFFFGRVLPRRYDERSAAAHGVVLPRVTTW
jgi:hypothetical protein